MPNRNIAHQRLHNQRIAGTPVEKPEDAVCWLGAVQAQDYAGAKWALGVRSHSTDQAVEQAFNAGAILRTHILRPTWHFVAPQDIRWLLTLTAPRVHAINAYMYRQCELDELTLKQSNAALIAALRGDRQLTRVELGSALAKVGIPAEGMRLAYLMMYAELEGILCSGGRRGKQFTYALLDERAPGGVVLNRDEALTELAKRYFTSHGPALLEDFAWWSGLTKADAKAGVEMAKPHLLSEMIDGKSYVFASMQPTPMLQPPTVLLLPPYDEYTIAYKDHSATLDPMYLDQARNEIIFGGVIVVNGMAVGYWKRTFSKGAALIELTPFRLLMQAELDGLALAAARYSAFLEMPVTLL